MTPEGYFKLNHKTPAVFEKIHAGKSVLIIGTGPSTSGVIKYKEKLKTRFDVLIGLNFATNDFEDVLDYHVVLEKNPAKTYTEMRKLKEKFRKDLPRILNWKTLDKFPKDLNIFKATRSRFGLKPDITKYKYNGSEGLLIGPPDPMGLSAGTVMLNGIHLACIMGFRNIYLVGADLVFKDQHDHYYPDNNFYRKSKSKRANRSPIVKVQCKGSELETTEFFAYSARYIDEMIEKQCVPKGIRVYDFSDGLLNEPIKLDIDEFFWGKE